LLPSRNKLFESSTISKENTVQRYI